MSQSVVNKKTKQGATTTKKTKPLLSLERIESKIVLVRNQKIMLDKDLAELYGVETKQLLRTLKRNISRFPHDFMFSLTNQEVTNLRYQSGTSSLWGGRRYKIYAFTEQGVAMLSSVLRSKRAVQVNIEIMRAFVKMRQFLISRQELSGRIDDLEKKYDLQFKAVFEALRALMQPEVKSKNKIGFSSNENGRVK